MHINAQERKYERYAVGFYNLENLFDTIHDDGKNDYEFLPDGKNKWGTLKYTNKLNNMARVLNEMSTDILPEGLAAVGFSEIENSNVLKDLAEGVDGIFVLIHELRGERGLFRC